MEDNFVESGEMVFAKDTLTLFRFSSARSKLISPKPNVKVDENTPPLPSGINTNSTFAKYGEDNSYPQIINEIISRNNTLSGGIYKRCASIFGNGIKTSKWVDEYTKRPINYKPFRDFVRAHQNFAQDLFQIISDLLVYRWAVPEFHFNLDGSKIIGFSSQKVCESRLGYDDPQKALNNTIILNADWPRNGHNMQDCITLQNNPFSHYSVEHLRGEHNWRSMTNYIMIPHNELIYPKSAIHAAVDQGWVDISQDEARFIKSLIQNKSSILMVVEIADWYWPNKYGYDEWKKLTPDQRTAKKKKEVQDFNKMMTGPDNAGKTFLVDVKTDLLKNMTKGGETVGNVKYDQKMPGWTITTVDMAKIDGTLTDSADIARKELLWSIGLDWLTTGGVTQSNQTGGSAKQQSKNIELILDQFYRKMIIQIFNFIAHYNQWDEDIDFDFDLPVMQTLATMSPQDRQLKPNSTSNA